MKNSFLYPRKPLKFSYSIEIMSLQPSKMCYLILGFGTPPLPCIRPYIFQNTYIKNALKPILHYAFSLRFGNVCEHKRKKNVRKTQMARVFNQRIV